MAIASDGGGARPAGSNLSGQHGNTLDESSHAPLTIAITTLLVASAAHADRVEPASDARGYNLYADELTSDGNTWISFEITASALCTDA